MANKIATLKDKAGNTLYPVTLGSCVYTEDGKNIQDLIPNLGDEKYGKKVAEFTCSVHYAGFSLRNLELKSYVNYKLIIEFAAGAANDGYIHFNNVTSGYRHLFTSETDSYHTVYHRVDAGIPFRYDLYNRMEIDFSFNMSRGISYIMRSYSTDNNTNVYTRVAYGLNRSVYNITSFTLDLPSSYIASGSVFKLYEYGG